MKRADFSFVESISNATGNGNACANPHLQLLPHRKGKHQQHRPPLLHLYSLTFFSCISLINIITAGASRTFFSNEVYNLTLSRSNIQDPTKNRKNLNPNCVIKPFSATVPHGGALKIRRKQTA
jgi:hypothetical protein